MRFDAMGDAAKKHAACTLGGGGLVGTTADYLRFAAMLAGRGELDGVRLLAPSTVDYMATNHLPGGADLTAFGRPLFTETTFDGIGFGLGVSVVVDPVKAKVALLRRRVRLGRRRQHDVLGRSGARHDGRVHDPAAAQRHPPDPPPAAQPRQGRRAQRVTRR